MLRRMCENNLVGENVLIDSLFIFEAKVKINLYI